MDKITEQMQTWGGEFGRDYTARNALSLEAMEALYKKNYGITRTEMNEKNLKGLESSIRILEVGSNIGNQLLCLKKMGFFNLYGIELQNYAVELSKSRTKYINIIEGSAFDIPFKDACFGLVYTSGVLIHISPSDISVAMDEIYRCTSEYIWGFEYYADKYTEILYREQKGLLWKTDFAKLYLERFSNLELVYKQQIEYLNNNNNVDSMFLLRKK